ncbi:MAG: hypothetical protein AB7V42_08940 [Thermoleophilia bacterium]
MTRTRALTRVALLALAAASLGTAVGLPTAAAAPPNADKIRPTQVPRRAITEGGKATFPVTLTCEYQDCRFTVSGYPLSAKRGSDFTVTRSPAKSVYKLRRGDSTVVSVTVKAVDDAVCEGLETGSVRVTKKVRFPVGARRDSGYITIKDNDCAPKPPPPSRVTPSPAKPAPPAPAPAPAPIPDPAFPPDSGTPTITTTQLANGTLTECTAPYWIGVEYEPNLWFNAGCSFTVKCPPEAQVCSARYEARHSLEKAAGEDRVSLNSRITALSASGASYWFRDQSSAGQGFTRNEDPGVMIRGGESVRVEANGVRITPSAPNRSRVGASLTLERVS